MDPQTLSPESKEAVHTAKNAAQALESAREMQLAKAVEETALRTKESLLEALKEVFGDSDSNNPEQMKVLVRRIPILCTSVMQMHQDLSDVRDNIKWGVRIVIGAVILGLITLLIK